MKKISFLLALAMCLTVVVGCKGEQTTEADVKSAMEGQKPDPAAAEISSPMGKKGGPK